MSIQNINISTANVNGKCEQKCAYAFKYSDSNSSAKNNGIMITITYDSQSVPPVVYNEEKYTVSNISIVSPSIHTFNNTILPGEIIIAHNPVKGGIPLQVCIPLIASGDPTSASQLISNIIDKVASNAPSANDITNLNFNINLQDIVPKTPFFTYNQDSANWIVYGQLNGIPITSSSLSTLQSLIQPFPMPTPGDSLFYNSKGPATGIELGDGIYISCQPTGSSVNDTTSVEYNKNTTSSVDLTNITSNPTFQTILFILIGCIFFGTIIYGINAFYIYLSPNGVLQIKNTVANT